LFWKTNVLHLYFFSFELNNGCRIPKEKIEQHYISPFLCIYLSLLATNYFAFMHHFIFFKVNYIKKKYYWKNIKLLKPQPNFTDRYNSDRIFWTPLTLIYVIGLIWKLDHLKLKNKRWLKWDKLDTYSAV
jgi:hypothetical protein